MKVPKKVRSVLKECPHGGMIGLYVTEKKLSQFAKMIGNEYIDKIIPMDMEEQPFVDECPSCGGDPDKIDMDNTAYWETEKGSHGWCCATCGMVFQWG